jgi:hypothetical protein
LSGLITTVEVLDHASSLTDIHANVWRYCDMAGPGEPTSTTNLAMMNVEFLFWEGCPSHPTALADLRAEMLELGLDPREIAVREIRTAADAQAQHFVGSPTVRIEGLDVQPADGEAYGLSCRVYYRRDGRISPTPDRADVRDALAAANTTSSERN